MDVGEYLGYLGQKSLTGVTRARKLAAIREYFRYLLEHEHITQSPTAGVAIPKKEKRSRVYRRPDEYTRMLSAAGVSAPTEAPSVAPMPFGSWCHLHTSARDQKSQSSSGLAIEATGVCSELEEKSLTAHYGCGTVCHVLTGQGVTRGCPVRSRSRRKGAKRRCGAPCDSGESSKHALTTRKEAGLERGRAEIRLSLRMYL